MSANFKAYAKLNLLLDIIKKREDGYHDISSVMQSIDLYDEIAVDAALSDQNEIKVSCLNAGDFSSVKWDESNLVYKAAALILKEAENILKNSFLVTITVKKNIPDGAGMGGGSADAAAVLKALNTLLRLRFSEDELCSMGARLGADVPFCIKGGTALCEGIGEKMTSLPSPGPIPCVILKPSFSLSTKEMYGLTDKYINNMLHPDTTAIKKALEAHDTAALFGSCANFMEPAAISICPEISDLKQTLKDAGAAVSMMTGSGSAVFGLFSDEENAKKAFEELDPSKALKFMCHFCAG